MIVVVVGIIILQILERFKILIIWEQFVKVVEKM
jgi:hypothetical protein